MKAPISYIQKVNGSLQGIKFAPPDKYFRSILSAKLPVAYTITGQGTSTGTAELWIQKRIYEVKVFVDPVVSGKFDDPTQKAMELHEELLTKWLSLLDEDESYIFDDGTQTGYRIQLDGSVPITDAGVRNNIEWLPGTRYIGFQLNIPIIITGGTEFF